MPSSRLHNVSRETRKWPKRDAGVDAGALAASLRAALLGDSPVYEAVDALYGTGIGAELDELVVKSCLDFFDEGQSAWGMPQRERGFFAAWREVARRNLRLSLRGLHMDRVLDVAETPEGVIGQTLKTLKVPEEQWPGYFTRELARLHGWAGFIRWRASAKHYHWARRYPADLVDLLAVRLTLAMALLGERGRRHVSYDRDTVGEAVDGRTAETYLRHELFGGDALPAMAPRLEAALARGRAGELAQLFDDYVRLKRRHEATRQAARLRELAQRAGAADALKGLSTEELERLLATLHDFECAEGMLWLQATEAQAIGRLTEGLSLTAPPPRDKRPFVQALFCIDTRSEIGRAHV